MAQDENEFGSSDGTGVLHAAQHMLAGDIAGDAHAEDVPQAHVEDQFRGTAAVIDAA